MMHLKTGRFKLSIYPNTLRNHYKTKLNLKQTEGTSKMKNHRPETQWKNSETKLILQKVAEIFDLQLK